MATLSTAISTARTFAKTDSNRLPDADAITFANSALLQMFKELVNARESLFLQDSTRDVTSTELDTGSEPGRFLLPTDCYLIKNLWINLQDPTNQDLWFQAEQYDVSNLQSDSTWEWYKKNQPLNQPLYSYRGDWFEIAPTPLAANITAPPLSDALRLTYFILPTQFAATTDTVSYPYSIDTTTLAHGIAAYYLKTEQNELAPVEEQEFMKGISQLIHGIGKGSQVPTKTRDLPLTGYEF